VIDKCRYSAMVPHSSVLPQVLAERGLDTVVITGVGTNVCCESLARDAMMLDYRVIFVSDANATFDPWMHEISLMNVLLLFGDVVTADELAEEIMDVE